MITESISPNIEDFGKNGSIIQSATFDVFRQRMRDAFGHAIYENRLAHISFVSYANCNLVLSLPTSFAKDFIVNHYYVELHNLANDFWPGVKEISFAIDARQQSLPSSGLQMDMIKRINNSKIANLSSSAGFTITSSGLNANCTFENFISGEANMSAYLYNRELAHNVAGSTRSFFNNGIFMYADVGMGKTHLLQAVVHDISKKRAEINIAYLTVDAFTQHYVNAVKSNKYYEFLLSFSSIDLLIIDDFQFICGKKKTELECVAICEKLIQSGKHVIISSSKSLDALEIDRRSKSRLGAYFTITMNELDTPLKKRILQQKIAAPTYGLLQDAKFSDEILDYICENTYGNVRELEAMLNKIALYCHLHHIPISKEVVVQYLSNTSPYKSISPAPVVKPIERNDPDDCGDLLQSVARFYDISTSDICSKKRNKVISIARQCFAYIARNHYKMLLKDIGKILGGRGHSTVLLLIKNANEVNVGKIMRGLKS